MIDRGRDDLDSLLDRQRESWLEGRRLAIDELLGDSSLRHDPEARLDLIYNEVVVREELGEAPSAEEYIRRFPHLEQDLALHFEIHHAVKGQVLLDTHHMRGDESATDLGGRAVYAGPDLEDYELLGPLGQGGMGVVYKARHRRLRRLVALKMFQPGRLPSPTEMSRFQTEAEAIARLQHPNIIQIFEIGRADGLPYLSLELAEQGTLEEELLRHQFKPVAAAELIDTLARAVHHAHERHIVHRDLKPANVLFTRGGVPKISDFGLAKVLLGDEGQRDATRSGEPIGTPRYMAPEQAAGRLDRIGPATDVYALGTLLYECLTGQAPFVSKNMVETMDRIRSEEPLPPRRLHRSIPRDLETICLTCLHKEPGRRYASALALSEDLRRFAAGEPIHARPTPAWERAVKWCRRRPTHAALVALALASVTAFVVGLAVYHHLETERLAELRVEVARLMEEGREALERREEDVAQARFREAWMKVQAEPALKDYQTGVAGWLDHSRRAVNQQRWKQRVPPREFDDVRDEAILHSLLLDAHRDDPVRAARRAIRDALDLTVAGDPAWVDERERLALLDADLVSHGEGASRALARLDESKGPPSRLSHLRRAAYLERLGRTVEADDERLRAVGFPPTEATTARFLSGIDRLRRRDLDGAGGDFDAVLDAEPEHFMARFCLGACYVLRKRPAEARVALTACLAQRPRFAWSYLLRGQAGLQAGDPDGALRDFRRGLDLNLSDSARFAFLTHTGLLHLQAKQPDQAREALRKAAERLPDESSGWEHLATLEARQGRWAAAEALFAKAVALRPERSRPYRTRSACYRDAEKWHEALADLDRAVGREPAASPARAADQIERARLLLRLGRTDEALRATQEAREDDAEAWRLRAEILSRQGRHAEAVAALDRCTALGVASFALCRDRGIARVRCGKILEGIDDYTRALHLRADADVFRRRGWAFLVSNAPRLARRDFEEALKLQPASFESKIGRGLSLFFVGGVFE